MLNVSLSLNLTLLTFFSLEDSIDSGNFPVRGYLPLIWKDSTTHMHSLKVYVKERLPFAQDLSLENSADSCLCFQLALLHSVSYFFFLNWSCSLSLCMVFHSIFSNIDEVVSMNLSANVFLFGELQPHHQGWSTYSGGSDRPVSFSVSNGLTQMVNFPIRIPWLWLSNSLWISFFVLIPELVLQWLSLH